MIGAMRLNPGTAIITLGSLWLAFSALSVAVWWTRRTYQGFGRFAMAGPGTLIATLLLGLRGTAPDWLTVLCANGVFMLASVLYLEGARTFRDLRPRSWSVYAGALVTIGAVAVFTYIVPSTNGRAASMSAFLAVLFLLTAIALLRGIPPGQMLGLGLIGGVFALGGATHIARAAYFVLGPSLNDSEVLSGVSGAFAIAIAAEMSLFPLGFMLAVHERMMSDLTDASERVAKAAAEISLHIKAEAVLRDSERQHMLTTKALSALSGKLMQAHEQERARIAGELHDDLAQRVAALVLHLHDVEQALPRGTSAHVRVRQLHDQTNELAHEIEVVAQRLQSAKLRLLGLPTAADSLCRELAARNHATINFSTESLPEHLSPDIAICLFRVLQEALSNALKYAGVPHVTVVLRGTQTAVHLDVIDRGVGFDPETVGQNGGGLGLISMKERLNLVQGEIHFESWPGAGTTVRARVPLGYRDESLSHPSASEAQRFAGRG
jgi:signal transduction histidine kinase